MGSEIGIEEKARVLLRKGVPQALAVLAEGPMTSTELRRRTPIDWRALARLRREGLVEVGVKEFVEEVPVRRERLTYGLTQTGRRMMELHETLPDMLRITPRQLECMSPLREGRKTFKEIPRAQYTVLNGLVRRGLIDRQVAEVEEKRRVRRRKSVYALTKRGERAHEACRLIESLWRSESG